MGDLLCEGADRPNPLHDAQAAPAAGGPSAVGLVARVLACSPVLAFSSESTPCRQGRQASWPERGPRRLLRSRMALESIESL